MEKNDLNDGSGPEQDATPTDRQPAPRRLPEHEKSQGQHDQEPEPSDAHEEEQRPEPGESFALAIPLDLPAHMLG